MTTTATTGNSTTGRHGAGRNASPFLYGQEVDAVARVLHGGQYGHTDITDQFEQEVGDFLGVPDAVAVASGTAALHIALQTAGIGAGDDVIVPSMTFCATVQAVLACGANPRFAEVDPDTLCVTAQTVADALTPATRAVMPVLYGGRAVNLSVIENELANRAITVIEDAAQAFGSHQPVNPTDETIAKHEDANGTARPVGATSRLTCFSFGPIKSLTCGQGGMIIPRSPEDARAARTLRGLGIVESAAQRAATTTYAVDGFGYRAQMPSINAAIGLAQLEHFATAAAARKQLWRTYADALDDLTSTVLPVALVDADPEHSVPSMCVVRVPERDGVFGHLKARGIGVGVHYPPNHLQPFAARWRRPLPVTEAVGEQIMSLPFHQHLTDDDVHHVVSMLGEALTATKASR